MRAILFNGFANAADPYFFLYGIWGPGRYLDGSGTKNHAKLRSRIQIWTILGPNSMIFTVLGILGIGAVFGQTFFKKVDLI